MKAAILSSALLLPVVLMSLCTCAQAWRVDCTKFVFAPRCRGIAAKRSGRQSSATAQDTIYHQPSPLYRLNFPEYTEETGRVASYDNDLDLLSEDSDELKAQNENQIQQDKTEQFKIIVKALWRAIMEEVNRPHRVER